MAATKARLDMDHGFMQSIIKNQVDRDNFDKEVKAAKVRTPKINPSMANKSKKPDRSTYVPPTARSTSIRDSNDENDILFTFEYEGEYGDVSHLVVHQHSTGLDLAEKFGKDQNFDDDMVDALAKFLQKEIDDRLQPNEKHHL